MRRLRALVTEADARLEAGEPRAAWALLDQGIVWRARDLQALARLCAAGLAIEWEGEVDRYRQAMALGTFVDVARTSPALRLELPYPGRTWPGARIDELERAAWRWLCEQFNRQGAAGGPGA